MPMQTDLIGKKIKDGGLRLVSAFLILLAHEEFECHFSCSPCAEELGQFSSKKLFVLLAQVSSAAILFAENRYTEQLFFFFHGKKIFKEKKNFFESSHHIHHDFFPQVGKPSTEISRENKNFSAKMRKIGSTDIYMRGAKRLGLYTHKKKIYSKYYLTDTYPVPIAVCIFTRKCCSNLLKF